MQQLISLFETAKRRFAQMVAIFRPGGRLDRLAWVFPCVGLILVVAFYHHTISKKIHLPIKFSLLYTELPLLVVICASMLFMFRRRQRSGWVAGGLIMFVYGVHDYHVLVFGRVPNWRDASVLPELFSVLSMPAAVLLVALLVGLAAVVMLQIDWGAWRVRLPLLLGSWLLVAGVLVSFPNQISGWGGEVFRFKTWSNIRNVQYHGRLFMSAMREVEHRGARKRLTEARPIEQSPFFIPSDELQTFEKRNVHIIVLESFMDAGRFGSVQFNRPPMHDEMLELLGETRSASLSPHFAGGTAKSEFEVLCGVSAFGLHGYQEFKMLAGHPTYCLPRILKPLGYETIAFHPYKRSMYNRPLAYRSLGFDRIFFEDSARKEDQLYRISKTSQHVLDEDLYTHQLQRVRPLIESGEPILNYALSMEGHTPFHLDKERQLPVVESNSDDERVKIFANKTYYRSQALARYIRALLEIDPDSLIVATSDHLPPIAKGGKSFYDELGFVGEMTGSTEDRFIENFVIVVDRGEVKNLGLIHHRDLFEIILDSLSNGNFCAGRKCWKGGGRSPAEEESDYASLLSLGLGEQSLTPP